MLRTTDGGMHWSYVNQGLGNWTIQSLAVDPVNSGIVYAGTYGSGLFRSDDYGINWHSVNGSDLWDKIIYDIEIDPNNPNTLFVSSRIRGSIQGYLYKSTNGGETWALKHSFPKDYAYDVDIAPWDSNTVFLAYHNRNGYFRSTDGGNTFHSINGNLSEPEPWQIALDPLQPGLIYGGHKEDRDYDRSAYVSFNSGSSWNMSPIGLPVRAFALARIDAPYMRVLAGTFENGVYISDDRGNRWTQRGLQGKWINALAVAEGQPQIWYAAEQYHGIFFSKDYGSTWRGSETLLRNTVISGMREINGILTIAVFGQGVLQSKDGGASWTNLGEEIEDKNLTGLDEIDGQLYAMTLSGIYRLDGQIWRKLMVGPVTEEIDLMQERASESYIQPLETIQTSMELDKPEILRGIAPDHEAFFRLVSYSGKFYGASISNGLWVYEQGGWQRLIEVGQEITVIHIPENESELRVASCSEKGCHLSKLVAGAWVDWNQGLDGVRVNALTDTKDTSFAATSDGIYAWKPELQTWEPAGLDGLELHSVISVTGSSCNLAAGGVGAVYLSADYGRSWQVLDAENPFARFDSLISRSGSLVVGSKGAGLFEIITN